MQKGCNLGIDIINPTPFEHDFLIASAELAIEEEAEKIKAMFGGDSKNG